MKRENKMDDIKEKEETAQSPHTKRQNKKRMVYQ